MIALYEKKGLSYSYIGTLGYCVTHLGATSRKSETGEMGEVGGCRHKVEST